jgi:hypothetical protein
MSQVRSSQVKLSQVKPSQAKSSQVKPSQAKSSQVKPSQAKSNSEQYHGNLFQILVESSSFKAKTIS